IDHMPWAPEPEPWDVDTLMTTQASWGTPVDAKLDPLEQIGKGLWSTVTTTASGLWNLNPLSGGLLEHPWDKAKRVGGNWRDLGLGLLGAVGLHRLGQVPQRWPPRCRRAAREAARERRPVQQLARGAAGAAGPPCCRSPVAGCRCPPR